jgi:hypothetical protein
VCSLVDSNEMQCYVCLAACLVQVSISDSPPLVDVLGREISQVFDSLFLTLAIWHFVLFDL